MGKRKNAIRLMEIIADNISDVNLDIQKAFCDFIGNLLVKFPVDYIEKVVSANEGYDMPITANNPRFSVSIDQWGDIHIDIKAANR